MKISWKRARQRYPEALRKLVDPQDGSEPPDSPTYYQDCGRLSVEYGVLRWRPKGGDDFDLWYVPGKGWAFDLEWPWKGKIPPQFKQLMDASGNSYE